MKWTACSLLTNVISFTSLVAAHVAVAAGSYASLLQEPAEAGHASFVESLEEAAAGAMGLGTASGRADTEGRRRFSLHDLVDGEVQYERPRGWSRRRTRWETEKPMDESEVKLAPGVDDAIPEAVEHGDIAWTIAFMLLGGILVIVMLLHIFNWDDAFIRLCAYKVIATAVSIVLAVIINEAINVFFLHLLVGTALQGEVANSHHIVIGILFFYFSFFVLDRAIYEARDRPVWLYACALLTCHIVAIRGIFIFSAQSRQWESAGTDEWIVVGVVLLAVLVYCSCCAFASTVRTSRFGPLMPPLPELDEDGYRFISDEYHLRMLEHAIANHWRLVAMEAEDFAGCIIIAYLTFQAIAYAIVGEVMPINGYTTTTEAHHVWYLLIACVVLLILFWITTSFVIQRPRPFDWMYIDDPTKGVVRLANALHIYFVLTLFFCVLRVGEWALMISWPSYYSAMVINAAIMLCLAILLIFVCQAFYPQMSSEDNIDSWAENLDRDPVPLDDYLDSELDDYDSAFDTESDYDSGDGGGHSPGRGRRPTSQERLAERQARVAAMDPIERHERRHRIHARMSPEEREEVRLQHGRRAPHSRRMTSMTDLALALTCDQCGNRYITDSNYCRRCGKKRPLVPSRFVRPKTNYDRLRNMRRVLRHRRGRRPGEGDPRIDSSHYPTPRQLYDVEWYYLEPRPSKVIRSVIVALGVLVGVAVAKSIHAATETIIIGNVYLAAELALALILVAVLLCVVILPAWFLYLVPGARKSVFDHKRILELEALQWGGEFPSGLATSLFLKASESMSEPHLVDAISRLTQRRPLIRPYLMVELEQRRHHRADLRAQLARRPAESEPSDDAPEFD